MDKKNILVIFGGKSFEHDISIITAVMMLKNYRNGKFNLIPVYISKNNEWFFYAKNTIDVKLFKDFDTTYKSNGFIPVYLKNGQNYIYYKSKLFEKKIEVVGALNCCHGGIGEDGTLRSFLDLCNIPLSSGISTAMGICMDKYYSKLVFDGLGIKTAPYVYIEKDGNVEDKNKLINKVKKMGYPVIIKPASLGSSIGISLANNEEELKKGLSSAFEFDRKVLVEKAILDDMKEYNIACMKKQDKILVSDIDEAVKVDKILSFKDKYIGNADNSKESKKSPHKKCGGYLTAKKDFPAKIDLQLSKKMKEISYNVYKNLNLCGPVRIDFIVDKKHKIYLNEINTVPGSLAYYFFIPYFFKSVSDYIDAVVENAMEEYKHENLIKKEYITNLV